MRLYQINIACLYGIHCGHNFMFFFASLQWLFQHQRAHDDADSDTQASDHELAQPVEVLGDSGQCDYEMVEENEDQNFSALKSILQSPLHESEVVSKEDKKDKLESKSDEMKCKEKNIKGENLENKDKRRKLPDPVHKKKKIFRNTLEDEHAESARARETSTTTTTYHSTPRCVEDSCFKLKCNKDGGTHECWGEETLWTVEGENR